MKAVQIFGKISIGIALTLISVGAQADIEMQPGLWETTTSVNMPGMPIVPPPMTQRACITKEDLVPQEDAAKNCQRLDHNIDGNTVTWNAECKQDGRVMVGHGKITYAGDTYAGSMELEMGDMKMTQTMKGHRVGDCQK